MADNRNRNGDGSPFAFHSSESIKIDPKNRKRHAGSVRHVRQSERQLTTRNSAAFGNMGERGGAASAGGNARLSRSERRARRRQAREKRRDERQAERLQQVAGVSQSAGLETSGEAAAYVAQLQQKKIHDRRVRVFATSLVIALVLLPVLTILPTGVFSGNGMTLALFLEQTGTNIVVLANWITGGSVVSGISVVFLQMLAAGIVGAALALNGCIYQGALNNALASPSTLGVVSGGTLGTLAYTLVLGVPASVGTATIVQASDVQAQLDAMDIWTYVLESQARFLFSLVGCLIVVGLILCISHIAGRGKTSKVALLIAGQVFATLITGVEAVIKSYINFYGSLEQQEALASVVGGSINAISNWISLAVLAIPLVIGAIIIICMRGRLNVLAFDPDEAKTMGLSVTATRNFVIVVCTILTGVVVSMVGSIGFVGFIIPHIARRIVGPDFRFLVPVSMTFGAVFLMLCNYLMNMTGILTGALGVFTSLIGAVFFLVVVIKERRAGNVEWV